MLVQLQKQHRTAHLCCGPHGQLACPSNCQNLWVFVLPQKFKYIFMKLHKECVNVCRRKFKLSIYFSPISMIHILPVCAILTAHWAAVNGALGSRGYKARMNSSMSSSLLETCEISQAIHNNQERAWAVFPRTQAYPNAPFSFIQGLRLHSPKSACAEI